MRVNVYKIGHWLKEETQNQKVVGSNPGTGYRMDIFCCKMCIVCLKKTENKRKRGL